ncbi:MAG: CapA family protein [Bacillota bacterium]
MNRRFYLLLFIIMASLILLGACTYSKSMGTVTEAVYDGETAGQNETVPAPDIEVNITAVGDIMVHGPQLRAQYNEQLKEYDFLNNFQFVKPYIEKADISICNLETTLAGSEKKYSSYPRFNSPDALVKALKESGFDVVATANNHCIDTGAVGLFRTIQVIKENELESIGTKSTQEEISYAIKDVNGIKIAFTAYTYETKPYGKYKTINALKVPKEVEDFIDTFSYDRLQDDLNRMGDRILEMKNQGAEFIVFYLHWGNEYQQQPNNYQRQIAQFLSDQGVDIVLGSHPHVLQPIEFIQSADKEKETLVVYSLGNFLSNQRFEILKNRFTEDGLLININIKKNTMDNRITIQAVQYLPTWVHRFPAGGKMVYEIVPLNDALMDLNGHHLSTNDSIWRAQNANHNTLEIIESQPDPRLVVYPSIHIDKY